MGRIQASAFVTDPDSDCFAILDHLPTARHHHPEASLITIPVQETFHVPILAVRGCLIHTRALGGCILRLVI